MKTKLLVLHLLLLNLFSSTGYSQTIAVSDFSTNGVHATPTIAAKLTRLELVKINKYVVMDQADMFELIDEMEMYNCYGKNCLIELGEKLKVPLVMSGSIDGFGHKIVISIKLIDVENKTIKAAKTMEFDNQEAELQRMIGIVIQELHGITPNLETSKSLAFQNETIITDNVGHMNNSGPRVGFAYFHESELVDFMRRPENQGGLHIQPFTTNLGYQFEKQYIGTESFSALAEIIINIAGMEQSQFLPTLSVLNGFRVGAQGWEFAFGPSFGFKRTSKGFFSEESKNLLGREVGRYWSENDFFNAGYNYDILSTSNYEFTEHLDKRGDLHINTNWLVAFGRTFKAGALNIPFNLYYSYNKYGGSIGTSIGFNVTTRKSSINK